MRMTVTANIDLEWVCKCLSLLQVNLSRSEKSIKTESLAMFMCSNVMFNSPLVLCMHEQMLLIVAYSVLAGITSAEGCTKQSAKQDTAIYLSVIACSLRFLPDRQ